MVSQESFELVKSLGLGATAEVFWAVNKATDKNVALKVFNPIVHQDVDALSRLKEEVCSLKKLSHPNIVSFLGEHTQDKFYALELELIEGTDLRAWRKGYDLTLIEPLLWVLANVARGLGAAHEIEILHRDLKPENILIGHIGEVKITDFGLARQLDRLTMTRLGLLTGSLGYMAPEIINGAKATTQSDTFSFGVIAYELLVGSSPFEGTTPQALLRSVVENKEISLKEKNPLVPERISCLIEMCLNKNPKDRPETIWNVESEILSYLASTRLLPLCKELVVVKERALANSRALTIKNKNLHREIETIEGKDGSHSKERLLELAKELMILFPNDGKSGEVIEGLKSSSYFKISRVLPVLLALLIFAFVLIWKFTHRPQPEEVIQKAVATMAPIAMTNAASLGTGLIRFIAEPDVAIYVDGRRIAPTFWSAFKTAAGEKTIRLVKKDFLPIEKKIVVIPKRTVTVNAMGGSP